MKHSGAATNAQRLHFYVPPKKMFVASVWKCKALSGPLVTLPGRNFKLLEILILLQNSLSSPLWGQKHWQWRRMSCWRQAAQVETVADSLHQCTSLQLPMGELRQQTVTKHHSIKRSEYLCELVNMFLKRLFCCFSFIVSTSIYLLSIYINTFNC